MLNKTYSTILTVHITMLNLQHSTDCTHYNVKQILQHSTDCTRYKLTTHYNAKQNIQHSIDRAHYKAKQQLARFQRFQPTENQYNHAGLGIMFFLVSVADLEFSIFGKQTIFMAHK